jgi:DNA-directed RNA polymerase specialized sigma subunit
MKIPNHMTESQVLDVMEKVISKTAAKYTFYGYTVDDIRQESYIICIEAMDRYDEKRPLENFLSVNLSNRLKNFVRDNYFVSNTDQQRVKLIQPAQLDYEESLIGQEDDIDKLYETIDVRNYSTLIDIHLPSSMRMDYLKIINGVYITKQRKEEIIDYIKDNIMGVEYEEG